MSRFGNLYDLKKIRTETHRFTRTVETPKKEMTIGLSEKHLFGRELNRREQATVALYMAKRYRASRRVIFKARLALIWATIQAGLSRKQLTA